MKILAKVLLSSVFAFFAGVPGWAQDCENSLFFLNHDPESAINDLQHEVVCLNKKLQNHDYDYLEIQNLKMDLDTATTKIQTLTLDLETANRRIETLENSSYTLDHFSARPSSRQVSQPKPPASKPKAPARKPTSGFIPDSPPQDKWSRYEVSPSKPKAPVNKPTQQTAPKGNPWDKPTPAAKEGTH